MTLLIEKGRIVNIDSIDVKIVRATKDANTRVVNIIKSNPKLEQEWKEHQKRCDQAKIFGPIAIKPDEEQQIRKQEESLTNLLNPQKQDSSALQYRSAAISSDLGSSSHKEKHYFSSTPVGGCGCGLTFEQDARGEIKMSTSKVSAETSQHKKYAEMASSSEQGPYTNNTGDNKLAYSNPAGEDNQNALYQR